MTSGTFAQLLALSAGLSAGCTYDFDGAFAESAGGHNSNGGSGGASTGAAGGQGATGAGAAGGAGATGGLPSGGAGGGGGGGVGGMISTGGESAGGGTVSNELSCEASPCALGGNSACCWDEYQAHSAPFAQCIDEAIGGQACRTAPNANNGLESRIECQYPLQCNAGEICCAVLDSSVGGMPFYPRVHCRASCPAPNSLICDPVNPACAANEQCAQSSLLPSGYSVCIPL